MRSTTPHRLRATLLVTAVVGLVTSIGCTSLPASSASRRSVCAGDVSITEVAVTIVSAPVDSTIHMEVTWAFVDGSDGGTHDYGNVIGQLEPGQTYFLPPGFAPNGLVDLGRCLDIVSSPGVTYEATVFPVVNPVVILLYALNGGRVAGSSGIVHGHLP